MISAIVTSDNHLGAYYARFRPDRLEARRQALRRNFERVVDAAIERRAQLFLHAGDLFDRPDPRNVERAFVARQVRRLVDAGITICAIAGNHDRPRSLGYDSAAMPHEEMEALGAIHLFRQTDALSSHELSINGRRVVVWGMSSDFNRPDGSCPLEGYDHRRAGDIDIALLHYGVEQWAPPLAHEPCLSLQNLDRLQVDAICVGHLHASNQRRLPGGALLLNPGATEHINFGEEKLDCGFWALQMTPGHVDAEYVSLPTQPMRTLSLSTEDEGRRTEDGEEGARLEARGAGLSTQDTGEGARLEDGEEGARRGARGAGLEPRAPYPLPASRPAPRASYPLLKRWMTAIEAAGRPDQLLRVRLSGRLSPAEFRDLDLPALQNCGAAGNFHCQVETDGLALIDPLADLPIGYGVSFDVLDEIHSTTAAAMELFGDNPAEQEVCRQAGAELEAAYSRLTGRER